MGRQTAIVETACVCILLSLGLVSPRLAAAIDLSGIYVGVAQPLDFSCRFTFTQSGTDLTIHAPCSFGSITYTFDLAGTVDETTGAFSTAGVLIGLCENPGQVTMVGSGDGETFTAVTTCATITGSASGTKCNNGILDATEDCEDGNTVAGDCCSPTCQFDAAGTACTPDTNSCTPDVCDGAGTCQHPIDPGAEGMPCADDLNQCTLDVCDSAGQCTHPDRTGSCDDLNACSTLDTCAAGTCVGGPLAPECAGSIDLTGEWETLSAELGSGAIRRFTQTGAVLHSTAPNFGQTGTGWVNPATGAFRALTPLSTFGYDCLEFIAGTASADATEFSGTVTTSCNFLGLFGPYGLTGKRCDPVIGCACAADKPCTASDTSTSLSVVEDANGVRVRWRWDALAMDASFGDPTLDTSYRVCLETAAGSFVEVALRGSNWRKARRGFRYSDANGPVKRLWLRRGVQIAFLPTRVSLAVTLNPNATPSLPLTAPVRLRLLRHRIPSHCYEATFDNPIVNTSSKFRATD